MGKMMTIGTVPDSAILVKSFERYSLYRAPEYDSPDGVWKVFKMVRNEQVARLTKSNWKLGWNGERFSSSGCHTDLKVNRPKLYRKVLEAVQSY